MEPHTASSALGKQRINAAKHTHMAINAPRSCQAASPPCSNQKTIEKFKLTQICNFIHSISLYKEAFFRLMKYTKQTPGNLVDQDEYFPGLSKPYILKNLNSSVSYVSSTILVIEYFFSLDPML